MRQASAIEGVRGRNAVDGLLPRQANRAYLVAREIQHPWYRCQALAKAAAHLTDPTQAVQALTEALEAAFQQTEPNRVVTVSAWPISVLVARNRSMATKHVDRLLAIISGEPHTLRRADALLHLFEAVFSDEALRERVFLPLSSALSASRGWRAERLTRLTALVLAQVNPDRALAFLSQLDESRQVRRAKRMIVSGEWLGPHQFFPHYEKR